MESKNYFQSQRQALFVFTVTFAFSLFPFISAAQCPTPPGDPTIYGIDSWIGYVYSGLDNNNPPQNTFTTTIYRGYLTQAEQFNWNLDNASISGTTICGSYSDSFSVRFRMKKTFPAGYYTFTIGGDDGERLSFDGGATWAMTDWNYHAYQTISQTFFMSGEYSLVLENYDQGGQSHVSFSYSYCGSYSTPPTAINGTTTICSGTGTTLTASGGNVGAASTYQWGTGTTVGSNILAGQTGQSIIVNPTANTTYWVRRLDAVGCGTQTQGITQLVTVTPISSAPTSITGTTTVCLGTGTTLTASGGTVAAGSLYEWGTGNVGDNIISGQTGASIAVTPLIPTTYWVRRTNAAPCSTYTAAASVTVNVNTPPGDEVSYGADSWIGYVYATIGTANPPLDTFTVPYRGYVTEPETFNQNWGATALSGTNICGSYATRFAIRFKMTKNFPAGYYTFTVGGDDGYRLSIDGGATFPVSNWTDHGYATTNSPTYYLNGSTNLVLEYYEQGGQSQVSFTYVACTSFSTAPTGISGTTSLCSGAGGTTLTATGGFAAVGAAYQWGTGANVGSNTIAGQTNASLSVNPTATTTYWVRRVDGAPCNMTTTGVTQIVTIATASTAPSTISGTASICNGNSTTLTASGGSAAAGSTYQWGTGYTVGDNIISGQTASAITVGPVAQTVYWVRRVDAAPCNTQTQGPTIVVNVSTASTAPTAITGPTSICTNTNIQLVATGGTLGTSSTYQWGTGSTVGSSVIGGQTGSTYNVTPTATTTYWVRRIDAAPCAGNTAGITFTVTVSTPSTQPTSITGTSAICAGNSTTLTATGGTSGTGATYQWGTGYTIGENIISGQTALTMLVSPTTQTVYWVRRMDPAPCNTQTQGPTIVINVTLPSTAPTSINGPIAICTNTNVQLTATGGTLGSSGTYQWGTGATVGTAVISGQTGSSYYPTPTATTTYWVRRVDAVPCAGNTAGVTITVTVSTPSTQPSSISGTAAICTGLSTTLTATGGTIGTGASYVWGTGNVGDNIIAGQTTATYTISPTATTTYWVRRVDPTPCSTLTGGASLTVAVATPSTAPTSISNAVSVCSPNGGVTLDAVGGTAASGATYQWGTGSTVGSNVISGQTNASMNVNPTATAIYWVRRADLTPCGGYTAGVTVTVYTASTAPTAISGTGTICAGGSSTITTSGGILASNGIYQWGTGITLGGNIIPGQTAASITVSPTTTTTYWVRRIDSAPCNTQTSGQTFTVNVATPSTAPTSISAGTNPVCYNGGGTTLTANGGSSATGVLFQWGTGATVGNNIIAGQTQNTMYVNPTANTTYWVRRVDTTPCSTTSTGVTLTINVSTNATSPTSIAGSTMVCNGGSITLTAIGGALGTGGASYQWGTGYTGGTNIIAGQTGVSMAVAPTANTVYWVRIVNGAPCNSASNTLTTAITVSNPSTAPTGITTSGSVSCGAGAATLTATGGTAASGSVYQWGTGSTVGSNVISGQTGATITVSPTANTTYWVRRYDVAPCSSYTSGVTTAVSVSPPPGDPTVFGNNIWNVYGYSTGDITLVTAVYAGFYTQSTTVFDTQNGTNSWNNNLSPSSSAGWTGCPVPVDNFTMVHKRKGFPCGRYTLTMTNWDDASILYIDGVQKWACANWSGDTSCSGTVGTFDLDGNSTIEVRTRENAGGANASLNLVNINIASTAPTTVSGNATICGSGSATLTASGGTLGTSGAYQWGAGSNPGVNIISGQTSASITLSPTTTITYWVRRVDTVCGFSTSGITQTVTVAPATVAGTLTAPTLVICRNTAPNPIALSGNVGNVIKWQFANDIAFTSGVTDVANTTTTLSSNQMGPLQASRYYRAVVQNGSCLVQNTAPVGIIVPLALTYSNGSWNGTPNETTPVIITSNLTLGANLNVCSCQVTNTAIVTIPTGKTLIVQKDITVAATANMIVENNASLVQVDDTALDVGNITVKRNTTPMKTYDYTYWSSPVQGMTLGTLSPNSTALYLFNPAINNWAAQTLGAIMAIARGYIVRAPQGWSVTNASGGIYSAAFTGVPNSGIIPATIQKASGTFNLIGNPYPSAIDIDKFLLDPANMPVINGTVYLWTHNTAISSTIPGNQVYNYTRDDYAKYNITGGVKTASTAVTGGVAPTGKIASGQAFFIEANPALANGTYTANFNNSMRVVDNNTQFFRTSSAALPGTIEKHRFWLHLANATGAYDEMLTGYVEGATNDFDLRYDGKTFPAGNVVGLYSILGDANLSIQGRVLPFDVTDVIPVGYTSTIGGALNIGLENLDGLFENQDIYLLDRNDNSYHDLKQGDYAFTSEIGTFNTRFEIHYTPSGSLGTNPAIAENNLFISRAGKKIAVDAGNAAIFSIEVFDLSGKAIYARKDIGASDFKTTDLNCGAQVLLVKVILEDNHTVSKKIMME